MWAVSFLERWSSMLCKPAASKSPWFLLWFLFQVLALSSCPDWPLQWANPWKCEVKQALCLPRWLWVRVITAAEKQAKQMSVLHSQAEDPGEGGAQDGDPLWDL